MNILIADDQTEVRSALKVLLEQEVGLYAVEVAEDHASLLQKLRGTGFDILLLDWELKKQTMSADIPALRQLAPGIRIVALSVHPEAARAAEEAGVDAFVSKGENSDRLLNIIRSMPG